MFRATFWLGRSKQRSFYSLCGRWVFNSLVVFGFVGFASGAALAQDSASQGVHGSDPVIAVTSFCDSRAMLSRQFAILAEKASQLATDWSAWLNSHKATDKSHLNEADRKELESLRTEVTKLTTSLQKREEECVQQSKQFEELKRTVAQLVKQIQLEQDLRLSNWNGFMQDLDKAVGYGSVRETDGKGSHTSFFVKSCDEFNKLRESLPLQYVQEKLGELEAEKDQALKLLADAKKMEADAASKFKKRTLYRSIIGGDGAEALERQAGTMRREGQAKLRISSFQIVKVLAVFGDRLTGVGDSSVWTEAMHDNFKVYRNTSLKPTMRFLSKEPKSRRYITELYADHFHLIQDETQPEYIDYSKCEDGVGISFFPLIEHSETGTANEKLSEADKSHDGKGKYFQGTYPYRFTGEISNDGGPWDRDFPKIWDIVSKYRFGARNAARYSWESK